METRAPHSALLWQLSTNELLKRLRNMQCIMTGIIYTHFPKHRGPDANVLQIVNAFKENRTEIDSAKFGKSGTNEEKAWFNSDYVLGKVAPGLKKIDGMLVEEIIDGKKKTVPVPVLYGDNGKIVKSYNPDGWGEKDGILLEVECGMMVIANKTHLEDLIKAIQIPGVKHFVIAAARTWDYRGSIKNPFERIVTDFTSFYESNRVVLPFETLTIIGF